MLAGELSLQTRRTTFGLAQGLPGLSLSSLEIDSQGLLWIGTTGGLFSYDGSEFRSLPTAESDVLRGGRVAAMHLDRKGVLWIGAADGALVQSEGGPVAVPTGMEDVLGVQAILETSDGSLWFGGREGLVRRFPSGAIERLRLGVHSKVDESSSHGPGEDPFAVSFLVEDPSDGSILVGARRRLLRWSGSAELEVIHAEQRTGLFFDERGKRWELSPSGRVFCDGERQFFGASPGGRWAFVEPIGQGRYFVGSATGNFVFSIEGGVPEFRPLALGSPVRSLVSSEPGSVWLASINDGLALIESREHFTFEPPTQGDGKPLREAIQVDDGRILVNRSEDDGVLLIRPTGVPRLMPHTEFFPSAAGVDARTHDACLSSTGEILIATSAGLGRLIDGRLVTPAEKAPAITCIARASDGFLWARQDEKVVEMREDGTLTGRFLRSPGRWSESFVVHGDRLYLTRNRRLFECDLNDLTTREVEGCPDASLRALYMDEADQLWITSYGGGLNRLWPDGRMDHWSVSEGLPDRFLGWIGRVPGATEASKLWINSNNGAICVSVESLNAVADGTADLLDCRLVNTNECSGIGGAALKDGTLMLPTMGGIVALDSAILANEPAGPSLPPGVYLRSVRINDREVSLADASTSVGESDLEFFFDIVQLPSAHRVETQSMLIGHDDGWVRGGGERSRRYTNLDEGSYQFAIRARGSSGGWGDEVRSMNIEIRRHWYAQTWFLVSLSCGLIAAAVAAFRLRTGWLMARSRVLEAEIARRENAERELLGQRRQFESVLEGAHDGIFAFDSGGQILYANPAMHWTFGAASVDLVGAKLDTLGIPGLSDEESLNSLISESETRQRWKTLEASARRMSGDEFDLEISIASDANSEDGCFVGIVRDISDRKQMLERLRFSEERYRRLYQTAPMAIIVWKPRLRMLEWNQQATDFFGWNSRVGAHTSTPKDIDLLDVMEGETSVEAMRSSVRRVLSGGRDCVETVRTRVARGEVRNCRWHLAPLMQPNGKVWAFISMVIDMSAEDRVALEFKTLRSQLARAEETERARIARELHDDLSQRMAAVALDLQMNETRIVDLGDADLAMVFKDLRETIESVASDVHTLSRQLHPTVLDDLGLFSALRSECARRAKRSGVEIICEGNLKGGEPRGATGLALFRVVQEALQNALTHGHATQIAVAIFQDGDQLDLTVEDNGGGFSVPKAKGSDSGVRRGIGFASMRERMILVGGDLRVNTMLGTGTVVRAVVSLGQKAERKTVETDAGSSLMGDLGTAREVLPHPPPSTGVSEPARDASDRLDQQSL